MANSQKVVSVGFLPHKTRDKFLRNEYNAFLQ